MYLMFRLQSVIDKFGDSYLDFNLYFLSGILQGSVLGPLSLVIFINDFPQCYRSATPYLYADTKCIISIHNTIPQILA